VSPAVLERLGLVGEQSGATDGAFGWAATQGADGTPLLSVNPATGGTLGRVRAATDADYERLLAGAVATARQWRSVPAPRRGEAVRLVGDALRAHKADLGELVTLETGKILSEGLGEVQEMIDLADFAVGQSRMLYGLSMHSERAGHRMLEQWHPLGVVGVVTAFNFPVAVWAWNALVAAVCGNVTVWKPSPRTPLTAIAVQKLCNATLGAHGFPPVFQLFVDAGTSLATRLVDDPRVPLLSFTGSTEVGRHVAQRVAARLGRSLLELGGNNALLIDETADLDAALPAVVFGAVGTAGQRCTTTRRLIVHRSRLEETCAKLVRAYRSVHIGDPLDPRTLMGPLIDAAAVARFEAALAEARADGAEVLVGGRRLGDRPGHFVEPAVVLARNDAPYVQRETFGPILWVIPCDDLDAAVELQNASRHGLSSALFTRSLAAAERFLGPAGSDCGIANVNLGTSGAEIGGAFGGEKDTGGGRESGSDAWKAYMRRQTCTINGTGAMALAQGVRFELG
jgi:aldehyde dehydrogenase (NAD+)